MCLSFSRWILFMNSGKDKINMNIKDVLRTFLIKYYLTSKCSSPAFPAAFWLLVNLLTVPSTEMQMSGL